MSKDPIERLRRVNPVPDTPAAPPIEPLLASLGERGSRRSGNYVDASGDGRRVRGLRAGFGAAPVALAAVLSIVIAVIALTVLRHRAPSGSVPSSPGFHVPGGLPPVPSLSPGDMHALDYHWRTRPHVAVRGDACAPFPESPPRSAQGDHGTPSPALLADYSVLQSPLTSKSALPASLSGGPFANYGRVAQRRYGSAIEVIPDRPAFAPGAQIPLTARCEQARLAAQRKDLAGAPAALIARALRIDRETFEDERYIQQHPDGICVFVNDGGDCGPFLLAQARGSLTTVRYGRRGSLNGYLVPNGVAKITVEYTAAGSNTAAGPTIPPLTINVPVINNVAVWTVSNRNNLVSPHAIAWVAENGKTLRTAYP